MRVGADHHVAGYHKSLFGKQRVLNAHAPHVKEVGDLFFVAEGAAHLALLGCLDILVGGKVIHDHGHLVLIEHLGCAKIIKLTNGNGRGNIVAQNQIQINQDQLSCLHAVKTCVRGKDFLRHCHSHNIFLFA